MESVGPGKVHSIKPFGPKITIGCPNGLSCKYVNAQLCAPCLCKKDYVNIVMFREKMAGKHQQFSTFFWYCILTVL